MKKRNTFKFCVLVLLLLLCSGCGKKEKYSVDMGDGSTRQLLLTQEAPRPELTDWELPQRDGWVFCGIYGEYRMKGGSTHDYRLYDSTLQPTKEPGWEFDRVFLKWVPETVSLNEKNLKQFLELSYEASVEMTEYNNNGLRIPGMIKAVITLSPNDDWSFIGPVCVDAEVTMDTVGQL